MLCVCDKNIGKNGSFLTDRRSKAGKWRIKAPMLGIPCIGVFVFMKQD